MQDYKDINNTRYIINRVFADNKTSAQLIEEKIIENQTLKYPLTQINKEYYNNSSF